MQMTFDQYILHIMTLDINNKHDVDILFHQLSLLGNSPKGIAMKVILQHVVNMKFSTRGLIT